MSTKKSKRARVKRRKALNRERRRERLKDEYATAVFRFGLDDTMWDIGAIQPVQFSWGNSGSISASGYVAQDGYGCCWLSVDTETT